MSVLRHIFRDTGDPYMKVHSIQFKYLVTVIAAILAIAIFIGGFSIREVDNYIQDNTKEFVDTTCSNEATKINAIFSDIEKSVKIMESYVLSLFAQTTDTPPKTLRKHAILRAFKSI